MSDNANDIKKEVKIYLTVFGALMFLTIVTVAVSYLKVSLAVAITIALFVATIKASLVACYFMHLISEKKLIYFFLTITVFFFIGLLGLPVISESDKFIGIKDYPERTVGAMTQDAHPEEHH